MEIHRLTPMKEGYDENLFNDLYKRTEELRKALAYQINHKWFGVDEDEVLSWFDDKFIFVFNKYIDKPEGVLLGHLINSLKLFKYRILRKAYQQNNMARDTISLDGEYNLLNIIRQDDEEDTRKVLVDLITEFIKERLSRDAYNIFQTELNPPAYIINKLKNSTSKIPINLLMEFLDILPTKKNIEYVQSLKQEVEMVKIEARNFFSTFTINPYLN